MDYNYGDTGPGGGTIFANEQRYGEGKNYMVFYEAAPASYEFRAAWGPTDRWIRITRSFYYDGRKATEEIKNQSGSTNYAAKRSYELLCNGKTDWYMPAQWEMNEMFNILIRGGFMKNKETYAFQNDIYWCTGEAGERDPSIAYVVSMVNGRFSSFCKTSQFWVRPVRSFAVFD